jgi:hypothetical protein
MKSAGSILSTLIKTLGIEDKMTIASLQREWFRLFNEPLSLHTYPVELKDGELLVNVDSPLWLQQLKFFKGDMLKKLHGYRIVSIRFKHGSAYRSRRQTPIERPDAARKEKRITDTDREWINQIVGEIKDPELSEQLRKLLEKAIRKG